MKTKLFLLALASSTMLCAKDIYVNTPGTTLLLKAEEGQPVHISHYGSRVDDAEQVYRAYSLWADALPTYGSGSGEIDALSVRHIDGNLSTELVYVSDRVEQEAGAKLYTVTMKDRVYPFEVDLCYRAYQDVDVIEAWTVLRNKDKKKPITLLNYASAFLPIRQGNVWLSHQHGAWGDEGHIQETALQPGSIEVSDRQGTKNAFMNRPNVMLSLDGKPQENQGRVIGAALCWSGNFRMTVETQYAHEHRLVAGIDNRYAPYTLQKGQSFTTPACALTYSNEGMGGASRNYHRWARRHNKVYDGQRERDILLNSWEGVYLNVSQRGMEEMMDGVKTLGGELFVMDDGWFGRKYRRTVDDCALGDWVTDTVKLPLGVPALEKAATQRGLKWGIWIEPEMVNTKSELYEQHPDWVICPPTREVKLGRGGTQTVLDMSNPKVQDFVFSVVDNIMQETPNTYYIKWDANHEAPKHGSTYLSADQQSHLWVDYHLGLEKTLQRIRAKYPKLVIQCCASGGGRVNYGLMPYFDEFWTSDNTDAVQRLFIQWGTSMYFPAGAMACHVSASPNHQTGRQVPLKFRFDVAMMGRLGMEMKPSDLKPDELEFAQKAFATYKEIRPIIQLGDQYRLVSPYEGKGFAGVMYVTEDKSDAVFFAYKFEQMVNQQHPRFRMAGLDPNATYRITEFNRQGSGIHCEGATFKGSFLMEEGIEAQLSGVFGSRALRIKKI